MLWRLIFQSWRRNLRRKSLAVAAVFLSSALISALLAVSINVGDKMAREMKAYGANILIESAGQVMLTGLLQESGNAAGGQECLDESELPKINGIFWRNNLLGFAPVLTGNARAEGREVEILGTYFDKHLPLSDDPAYRTGQKIISPYWKIEGEWPDDERAEALAGRRLAEMRGWKPGSRLVLRGAHGAETALTLTGIVETGGTEERQLVMPLALAQQLLNLEGKVQNVRVSALTVPESQLSKRARRNVEGLNAEEYDTWYCTAYVSSIAHQLEEALPGTAARPIWQVAASEGVVIQKIQLLLVVATVAALVAAAMGIASLTANTIMERAGEIGLMKALNARLWQIMILFYAEAVLGGLLGGALGCAAGWVMACGIGWSLFGGMLSFHWIVIPAVLIVSVLISLAGTWFPAQWIIRMHPAEVLYGRH